MKTKILAALFVLTLLYLSIAGIYEIFFHFFINFHYKCKIYRLN